MLNKHSDGKIGFFQKKVEGIIEQSSGSNKAELQTWLHNGTLKKANNSLKRTLYVRTIISTKEEQNLLDFFYPTKVKIHGKEKPITLEEICNKTSSVPSLIIGTVGQGKSIALRYLSFYTLAKTNRIPIFLELRKLRTSAKLFEQIKNYLESIGLPCSDKLLKYLLSSGCISLFLDGFDEVKYKSRVDWVADIEDVSIKYPETKLFVSTRPNTDIHQHHAFKNLELMPLQQNDRPNFIKKLVKNEEDHKALISKLTNADEGVTTLLETPLLMVLFVSVYNNRRKLPNSNSEFFDELFSTILSRHDGLKPAYDRPTKSGFTDKELKLALQAFCYQTRKANLRTIPEHKIADLTVRSLNIVKLDSGKASDFIKDIGSITCLLLKESQEYRFINDSVQEYFSASFVKEQEEVKSQFYEKYLNDWHHFYAELNFLQYIDEVAYTKFFYIPSIVSICDFENDEIKRLKLNSLNDLLGSTSFILYEKDGAIDYLTLDTREYTSNWALFKICSFGKGEANTFTDKVNSFVRLNWSKGKVIKSNIDFEKCSEVFSFQGIKFHVFNALEFFSEIDFIKELHRAIDADSISVIQKKYKRAVSFIEQKKQVAGVF